MMGSPFKTLACFLLIVTFLFTSGRQILGQEKVSLSAGLGIPELINVGMQYRIDQTQLGIGFGYFPQSSLDPSAFFYWGTLTSISGDIYYHFGKLPATSNPRPWYVRLEMVYTKEELSDRDNKMFFLSPRIGRDINISDRIGFSIDLGINMAHYISDPSVPYFLSLFGLPGMGIRIFCRI